MVKSTQGFQNLLTSNSRHPLLIIGGGLGVWILIHLSDYIGFGLASYLSGQPLQILFRGEYKDQFTILGRGIGAVVAGIPMVWLVLRFVWRRTAAEIGLSLNLKWLVRGMTFGLLLPWLVLGLIHLAGGHVTISVGSENSITLLYTFVGSLCWVFFISILEEVVFRGIIVRELAIRWHWLVASVVGGQIFAFAHLAAFIGRISLFDFLVAFVLITLASFLFTSLYFRSGSLWLPVGFHTSWNFSLKFLLCTTLSGKQSSFGLLQTELSGNSWLTGGYFGLELSVVTVILYLSMSVILFYPFIGKIRSSPVDNCRE